MIDAILDSMFDCLSRGNPIYLPSKFWESYNQKNLRELEEEGLKNIKQTVAGNYFTWLIHVRSDQFRYLVKQMRPSDWPSVLYGALRCDPASPLSARRQIVLSIFTRLLWRLAERRDREGLLQRLEEPLEGNPARIFRIGKLISQDVANSVLEYYSMREHFTVPATEPVTVCELGAGYGRNAYVFLNAMPRCKYIIVDIPPALYISQQYLSSVLKDRKIFHFRCFDDYSEVASELEEADLIFLLPHQAEMLPQKSVDLFVNISSLHEMTMEQIITYFHLIDRLTKGYFYTKQWLIGNNPFDQIFIKHDEYPIPAHWRQLYLRQARVQTAFFEAMYAIPPNESGA